MEKQTTKSAKTRWISAQNTHTCGVYMEMARGEVGAGRVFLFSRPVLIGLPVWTGGYVPGQTDAMAFFERRWLCAWATSRYVVLSFSRRLVLGGFLEALLRRNGSCGCWVLVPFFNALAVKLFNWNFHRLKVVSRWRDPQLQVSENYSDLLKWSSTILKSCWLISDFIF